MYVKAVSKVKAKLSMSNNKTLVTGTMLGLFKKGGTSIILLAMIVTILADILAGVVSGGTATTVLAPVYVTVTLSLKVDPVP